MKYENLKYLESFTEKNLPSLTQVTLGALELFIKDGVSKTKIKEFKKPLVVGSGNAIATAKILYANKGVIFADENNYKEAMQIKDVDGVLIFSASGAKHAPIIAKEAKKQKLECQLITCSKNSDAEKIVGSKNTIITSKNREPYTYNTSTYMGWILAKTQENPKKIYEYITSHIKPILSTSTSQTHISNSLGDYSGYLLVLPNQFEGISNLFNVKFVELFGRQVARDVYTYEQLKHAVTVVPNKAELAISFGKGDFDFQGDTLNIPLPKNCGFAAQMAIGYYVIGHIQEQKKQYFKENIASYIKRLNKKSFGKGLKIIVE